MDAGTLEQVLYHIHNWFARETIPVSKCEISNGSLPASIISRIKGNWYRICGSFMNDGLHHIEDSLTDETFDGTISVLAIPNGLLSLVDEIEDWISANAIATQKAIESPYSSESFGGYSYSIRGDLVQNNPSGGLTGWQSAFASRLNPWRKMY